MRIHGFTCVHFERVKSRFDPAPGKATDSLGCVHDFSAAPRLLQCELLVLEAVLRF